MRRAADVEPLRAPEPGSDSIDATRPDAATGNVDTVPALRSRAEAALFLGIGRTTLYGLITSGELPAVRIGRRVLVHADDLADFADRLRDAARTGGGPA